MGTAAVKLRIMPSSPEVNLEEIKNDVSKMLSSEDAQTPRFEEEPIAFGLKALIATFGWPEEKPLESFQDKLSQIANVNSVELIDIRRAIG